MLPFYLPPNLGLYAKLFLNFVCIVSLSDLVFINACAWIKSFISMTVCPKKEFLSILYNIFNNTRTAYMRHPCRIKPCSASLPHIAVYYQDTKKHYFFSQMSYKKTFYHSLRIFIKLNQTNWLCEIYVFESFASPYLDRSVVIKICWLIRYVTSAYSSDSRPCPTARAVL